MGILSDIGEGAAIAVAADVIWGKLNTARTCLLQVTNATDFPLRVSGHSHAHGGFGEPPSMEIPPHMVDTFGSESAGGSIFTGTEGWVSYEIGELATVGRVRWNNPFIGSNDCSAQAEGDRAAAFEFNHICGGGNDAQMNYELRLVRDPRFVRPPDYRWVRLEGYAYDPGHNWWSRGPDDPPDFPSGHRVSELRSWWSPSREDNWAMTDPRHTSPLRDPIAPDYRHYRLEGYILDPDSDAPPETVPLHSWWSPSRGDNWATTDPRHTSPIRERISPDYRRYRLEGHLFSPREPQPANTVPVHSWWSASRGDNFITTDPRYYP